MPTGIAIFSTLHILVAIYSRLAVGACQKAWRSIGVPEDRFPPLLHLAVNLWPLFVVSSVVWAAFALRRYRKTGVDVTEVGGMFFAGAAILVFFGAFGSGAFIVALTGPTQPMMALDPG